MLVVVMIELMIKMASSLAAIITLNDQHLCSSQNWDRVILEGKNNLKDFDNFVNKGAKI